MSLRMYFKAQAAISLDSSRGRINTDALGVFSPDLRVVEGVEGLIRAGYLLKPQRDDIGTSVPRAIRERFDRIVGNKTALPRTALVGDLAMIYDALSGRGLDQLDRVVARPFGGAGERRQARSRAGRSAAWSACRTPCRPP